jgi:hypothetical protein
MTGEINTASNIGSSPGIGLFIQKTGVNLEFRKVGSGSEALVISLSAPPYQYPDSCSPSPLFSPSPYLSPSSPSSPALLFTADPISISHRLLADLSADDHTLLVPRTGVRGFLNPVSGKTPTLPAHLVTKAYADTAGADKNYVHNQISAATTWTVLHNLNKYPTVNVIDSGNTVVLGDIVYNSLNQLTVTLSALSTGKVYCN